jgi:hypothetical protein
MTFPRNQGCSPEVCGQQPQRGSRTKPGTFAEAGMLLSHLRFTRGGDN